jgi:thiamine transport system permease protein
MLGASPFQVFRTVTFPLLRPAIFAGAMLVFIFCFSSFGVVLILGGPSYATIEVEIYRQAAHLFNLPVASTLAIFQICFTFLLMWVYTRLQKKNAQFMPESDGTTLRAPTSIFEKGAVGACVLFILLFCLTPVAALVLKSIWHGEGFSLIYYRELFMNSSGSIFYVSPVDAMTNSLLFACSTLAMALVIGGCAAFTIQSAKGRIGGLLDPLFMLPLSTSAVTLGFGMIITLDKPPLNIRTSMMLIPIVHTLVAFPFVVRSVLPALRSIPPSLKEAATLLGASPRRVWFHIELPIAARALSVGAVFAFTVSLGEFGATVFAARPEFTTLPVTIYKYLGQPGTMNYGQAMAVSSLLMLVTAAGFLLIEKIRKHSGREGF